MISWIQNTFEKHFKWLFIILLVVIIVSFVATVGSVRGLGEPETAVKKMVFAGFDLSDPAQVSHLEKGALLSQIMGTSPMLIGSNSPEEAVLSRALCLHWANTLNIPTPDEAALTAYLKKDVPAFRDKSGEFDAKIYQTFTEWAYNSPEFGKALTTEIVNENFRISLLTPLLSGGDVLPFEVAFQLSLAQTEWSVDVASLSIGSLEPLANPSDADLKSFYEAHSFLYEKPAQRALTYVIFPSKGYEAKVPAPTQEDLEQFYKRHASSFAKMGDDGKLIPQSFESVNKADVEKAYREQKAYLMAAQEAEDWVVKLYENGVAYQSEAFAGMLKDHGLVLEVVEPFSRLTPPTEGPFTPTEFAGAFALDTARYYSDAFPLSTGAGVFFLDKEIPAAIMPFEAAKPEVFKDYEKEELRAHFSQTGEKVLAALKEANAQKLSFVDTAKSQGLSVKAYDGFTLEEAPSEVPNIVLMELPKLLPGTISPMITLGDVGYFIHVRGKVVPSNPSSNDPDFQTQLKQMEQITALLSTSQLIQDQIDANLESLNKHQPKP